MVEAIEVVAGRDETEPLWLIMEWMPHDLCSIFVEDDDIPLLLSQVNSALIFMHSNGFAHRDLKPENIFIQHNRQNFVVKVADAGLSKYSSHDQMQTFAGSIAYIGPEIWESDSHYTNAVDMWSSVIVAVELWNPWNSSSSSLLKDMRSSRSWHQSWTQSFIKPRIDLAPPVFRPLLCGLLSESPGEIWTAAQCEQWLQTYAAIGTSVHLVGEEIRHVRSSHPTLSTTRAQSAPLQLGVLETELHSFAHEDGNGVDGE
ncbi:kinase-like domain-containing protein [Trichoderma austrokoningii]